MVLDDESLMILSSFFILYYLLSIIYYLFLIPYSLFFVFAICGLLELAFVDTDVL